MKTYIHIGLIVFLCLWSVQVMAQTTVRSNGTGGGSWDSTSTWQGGAVPGTEDSVVVLGTDSVYYHSIANDTCGSLTVLSGGKYATIITTDSLLSVSRVFTLQSNAWYFNGSSSGTCPGSLRVIDHASTVVHRGSGTVGGTGNLEFGNLIMNRAAGETAGGNLTIYGDLTVNNAGPTNIFRGANATCGFRSHTVHGNVYVIMGTWSCVDVGSDTTVCIWNVDGDVFVTNPSPGSARMGPLSSASVIGLGIFNLNGNLTLNGGRLQAGSSSTHGYGRGIINLKGNFTITGGGWVTTNIKGPFAFNFVGTGTQTVKLDSSFSMTTKVYDTVGAGSHVIFDLGPKLWRSTDTLNGTGGGAFVVNGTLAMKDSSRLRGTNSFILNPGATLEIGSSDGITAMPDSTEGNIQVTGTRSYSTQANYIYSGPLEQKTGDGLPPEVRKLTIASAAGVNLLSPVTVDDTLSVLNSPFDLNGNTLTLAPAGALVETPGNTAVGTVQTTRKVAASASEAFGGIGIRIGTSAAAPDTTTVVRLTGVAQTGRGKVSILRSFDISPKVNSALDATLDFSYDASELNGQNPAVLGFWKSSDNGSTWVQMGGTPNAPQHTVHLGGIGSFSRWTVSDTANPLGEIAQMYSVNQSWNMMSLPLVVPDARKIVVYPTATSSAFAFTNQYVTSDTIKHGVGYWLKYAHKETLAITGLPIQSDTLDLHDGWNLIGSVGYPILRVAIGQVPPGLVISQYYWYSGSYVNADTIIPGRAYWVKTGGTGQLIMHTFGPLGKQESPSPSERLKGLNSLTVTDNEGNSQTVYFGSVRDRSFPGGELFELPPLPPEGGLDVRFASQRSVETLPTEIEGTRDLPLSIHAGAYPLRLSWRIVGPGITCYTLAGQTSTGAGLERALKAEGSMTLSAPVRALSLLASSTGQLPAQYSLGENYPNPFNPSTQLRVGLPVDSRIALRVYNLLGQQVAEVAAGTFDAGYHTFTWSGMTDAGIMAGSGIYLCKFEATPVSGGQAYSAVRKMIMMK